MSPGAAAADEPGELARVATVTDKGGVVRMSLAGEVDISNVGVIEAELYALPNEAIGLVLDLNSTTFMDSSAVSLLYGLRERLRRRGQMLRIVAATGSVPRRVLELTGYEQTGTLDFDHAAAEAAIQAAAGRG